MSWIPNCFESLFPLKQVGILRILKKRTFKHCFHPSKTGDFIVKETKVVVRRRPRIRFVSSARRRGILLFIAHRTRIRVGLLSDTEPEGEASSSEGHARFDPLHARLTSRIYRIAFTAGGRRLHDSERIIKNLCWQLRSTTKCPGSTAGYPGLQVVVLNSHWLRTMEHGSSRQGIYLVPMTPVPRDLSPFCTTITQQDLGHTGVAVWLDFSVGLCQIPSEGGGSTNLLVTPTIPTATMLKDWLNTGLMLCRVASPWSGRP